jgi:hypothetical protein
MSDPRKYQRFLVACSQIVANTSVRAQPHTRLVSDRRKYQCSRSASYSPPLRYSQIPVFALRLIFPSSQILANARVSARKYQCSRSGSYSPPLRSSQIPVFALRLIQPHTRLLSDTRKYKCSRSGSYCNPVRHSQIPAFALANTSVRAQADIPLLSDRRKYQCSRSGSYSPPLRSSQIPVPLSLIFLSFQIVANTSVRAQPHIPVLSDTRKYQCSRSASDSPPLRPSQIPVFAPSLILLLSDTRNYQCSPSASYSPPLRYSQLPVFALSLRFPSTQIVANTSVRAQPHIPLLSDTRNYQCSRSASDSPPLRSSQIPVFAPRLIFLLSDTRNCQCSPSASYSLPLRYSQLPVFALSLRFPSSQIVANTSVRAQLHIPLLSDTRKYKCSRSASSSPLLRYSQLPVFALGLIFPSSQILANTSVRAQPHLPLLSDTRKYHCSHSASSSPPLRYSQIPVFALGLIFPSFQILANTSVRARPHFPLLSDTRKYQCSRSASYSPPFRYSQIPKCSHVMCIYVAVWGLALE